jgi:hypothetical protein
MNTRLSSLKRTSTVAIAASALAILPLQAPAADAVGPDSPNIDTYRVWNGTDFLQPFGHPDTTTYGQTITIPAGTRRIIRFGFWMASNTGTGTIQLHGEVYKWDGDSATGEPVWESQVRKVDFVQGDPAVYRVKFRVDGVAKVTPGETYVFFASTDKDYEETDPSVLSQWAVNTFDALPGGFVVYQNNAGDESHWTTTAWDMISSYDFAFRAKIR